MKPRSAKNKGKRLQVEVQNKLREVGKKFGLVEGDINNAIMGESGKDIKLSPHAEKAIPFDVECKNTEKINIWGAIEQAEKNTEDDRIPLVVFSRNRSKTYCVLEFDTLLELLYKE